MRLVQYIKERWKGLMDNELSNRFVNLLSIDVLIKGSGLILMYVYLKMMTESEYGIYGLVFNLVGSVSLFMNFGLYVAQTAFFHDYKAHLGKLIFNLNLVLTALLVVSYIIFYFTSVDFDILYYLIGKEMNGFSLPRFRIWIWIGITTQIFATMTNSYFVMSKRKIRLFQIYNACKVVVTNVFVIWALTYFQTDRSYTRVKYGMIADAFITLPFFFWYIKNVTFDIDWKLIRKSLFIGIPSMVTALIGSVYGLTDRNILLKHSNGVVLGVYTYAYTLTSNMWVFLQAFLNAFWPDFMSEKNPLKSYENTKRVTKKVMTFLSLVAVGMFLFAAVVDYSGLISLKYSDALNYMPLMLLTQLVFALSTILSNYYVYFNKTYFQIIISAVSLYINWQLCTWLIPGMQTWGAVLATLITTSLVCFINFWFVYTYCHRESSES